MREPEGGAESRPSTSRVGTGRKLVLSLLATVGLLLVLEGAVGVLLALTDADDTPGLAEEAHCAHDPDLGWVNEKNKRVEDLYGPHRNLTTNARGFRGLEEIDDEVPDGRYRILCLGDSFTLGYGVDDASTYPAILEDLAPAIQAVNMGQGGYGVDQAYLWYRRDAAEIEADLVILAFIAPDLERMLEERFNGVYPKPRLRVENGALVLPAEPVPDDWTTGAGGRRFGRFLDGLALFELMDRLRWRTRVAQELPPVDTPLGYEEIGEHVLRDLARLARERGHDLALVQVPLQDRRAGRPESVVRWITPLAAELGVPFLDLTEDFDAVPRGDVGFLYQADGHLDPSGNLIVAERIRERLRTSFPDLP